MQNSRVGWRLLGLAVVLAGVGVYSGGAIAQPRFARVVLLGTNDIHGGVEARTIKDGTVLGGMAQWAGIVSAIKKGVAQSDVPSHVLVMDAGDQFQGTLLSNISEGKLVFELMSRVGYDAAVMGNHDYDFGPRGWLEDQVTAKSEDQNPRGALEEAIKHAQFPLVSANTFLKKSFYDTEGHALEVSSSGCKASSMTGDPIDWSRAERPAFLKPYVILNAGQVRVAVIGIDNPGTPTTTTPANVSDLCFANEAETYLRVREEIGDRADVFVMLTHNGNAQGSKPGAEARQHEPTSEEMLLEFTQTVNAILEGYVGKGSALDAVIAGHTHAVNHLRVSGVPVIQSRSGGEMFGRVDLFVDLDQKMVIKDKTRSWAALSIYDSRCSPAADFCKASGGKVAYEGQAAPVDSVVQDRLAQARAEIAGIANRKVGDAKRTLTRDRVRESALADALTDQLRSVAGAEIAFMNTGGIRTEILAGEVTYEEFFKVLPFNNRAVKMGPMKVAELLKLLKKSIAACGSRGALMQSGLRVSFESQCKGDDDSSDASLVRVETVGGELIYDRQTGFSAAAERSFAIATLDFLAAGGSGYDEFKSIPTTQDLGVAREVMVEEMLKKPLVWEGRTDGRWKNLKP